MKFSNTWMTQLCSFWSYQCILSPREKRDGWQFNKNAKLYFSLSTFLVEIWKIYIRNMFFLNENFDIISSKKQNLSYVCHVKLHTKENSDTQTQTHNLFVFLSTCVIVFHARMNKSKFTTFYWMTRWHDFLTFKTPKTSIYHKIIHWPFFLLCAGVLFSMLVSFSADRCI